ncbi:MAG: hypothetical protein ABR506_11240 [Candidatus Krumholzibacteriia bacterium]
MTRAADPGDLPAQPWDRDDALLDVVRRVGAPRVEVYPWDRPAVVIGRGGSQARELDRDALRADGALLYRRPGGGCAVVLDPGNAVLSLGLPMPGIGGITGAFAAVSAWVAAALARCGLPDVARQGVSDLVLGDRKIGGSCIWRTRGLLYYSTTLLVDPDLDLVERWLPHPPREPDYRRGRPHRAFMGSLREAGFGGDATDLARRLGAAAAADLAALGPLWSGLP